MDLLLSSAILSEGWSYRVFQSGANSKFLMLMLTMMQFRPRFFTRLCLALLLGAVFLAERSAASTFVRMDFNLYSTLLKYQQSVVIELFDDRPITRNNFLQYVDAGHYDETIFHRLVTDFVLQGGGFYEDRVSMPAPLNVRLEETEVDLDGNPSTNNPTILNEFGNSPFRSNIKGTLAMAKVGGNPNSATNQFFFNLNNNGGTSPNGLDYQNGGFTVFAQVVGNGMSLIDAFGTMSKTNLNNDLVTQTTGGGFISNTPDNIRDFGNYAGPFGEVPYVGNAILRMEAANRTDYFSATSSTSIPSGNLSLTNELGFVEAGASFTGTGKFLVGTGKTLTLNHGANIARPMEVTGIVDLGSQVGAVTINNYKQFTAGKLQMQVAGKTAGTLYDQLNVTTTATLAGTLDVELLGSFTPVIGDTINLINAATITGNFSSVSLPTLRPGLSFGLEQTATSLSMVALPDYNKNGLVDQADLTILQNNFGSFSNLAADGDGDGRVDGRDFLLWQRYAGRGSLLPTPSFVAVPEPSCVVMVGLALLGFAMRRYR